jgi:hypothetical protein
MDAAHASYGGINFEHSTKPANDAPLGIASLASYLSANGYHRNKRSLFEAPASEPSLSTKDCL